MSISKTPHCRPVMLAASILFAVPCSAQEVFLESGQYLRVRINDELTSEGSKLADKVAATLPPEGEGGSAEAHE